MDNAFPKLSKSKISYLQPSSVTVQFGLCKTCLGTMLVFSCPGSFNRQGGSNVYPQSYVLSKNKKNIFKTPMKFQFLQVKKISVYCMGKFS